MHLLFSNCCFHWLFNLRIFFPCPFLLKRQLSQTCLFSRCCHILVAKLKIYSLKLLGSKTYFKVRGTGACLVITHPLLAGAIQKRTFDHLHTYNKVLVVLLDIKSKSKMVSLKKAFRFHHEFSEENGGPYTNEYRECHGL